MYRGNKRGRGGFIRGRGTAVAGRGRSTRSYTSVVESPVVSFSTPTSVVTDLKDFVDQLQKFCDATPSNQLATDLKQYLLQTLIPLKIKFNMETDTAITISLTTDRHGANFNNAFVRQANGAMIKISNREVNLMIIPANEFNNNYSAIDIEQFLRDDLYKIHPIRDGTTVNLYYDEEWKFATKNSSNISQMSWRGFPFMDVINECLKQYPEFSYDKLDKNNVYSLGFRNMKYHPFLGNGPTAEYQPSMWLICAHNRSTLASTDGLIGIPTQPTITIQPETKSIYNFLQEQCKSALSDYLTNAVGEPRLGFILRSTNPSRTGQFSDILIESDLFGEIKKAIYDLPYIKNKVVRDKIKNNFKNMTYVIAYNWLSFNKSPLFFKLFPQYLPLKFKFDNILEKTITMLVSKFINNEQVNIHIFNVQADEEKVNALCAKFLPYIKTMLSLSSFDNVDAGQKLVKNLIMDPRFADTYFEVFDD